METGHCQINLTTSNSTNPDLNNALQFPLFKFIGFILYTLACLLKLMLLHCVKYLFI